MSLSRRYFGYAFAAAGMLARPLAAAREEVKAGPLVLYGGGKPQASQPLDLFWKLAGGREARIVVVPTAHEQMDSPSTVPQRLSFLKTPWEKRGVRSLEVLHTLDRTIADSTSFSAALADASGIWFGGGDQRRLLNAYRDTLFHRRLLEFFQRGGVVGGSSAGTAVQSELTFVPDDRDGITLVPGFNLWPGAIVDQHFSQRGREGRLAAAIAAQPHLTGVGIDEFTAALVQGTSLEVLGQSQVKIFSGDIASESPLTLTAGERYSIDIPKIG